MADVAALPSTRDAFFGGRLVLAQPTTGHRAGTDAVLLAAAVAHGFEGHVLDIGAATGVVGLAIAQRSPRATVTLVDSSEAHIRLARDNIGANGLVDRVDAVTCDLLSRAARRQHLEKPADLVVTNPPYYRADRVQPSPDVDRRAAHVMAETATPETWVDACLACLGPQGSFVMIHDAKAVPDLFEALRNRLGALTLLPVYPRTGEAAIRVLIRGIKGSRAPFRLAPPLVLHEGAGFTAQAAALHEGRAELDW